VRRRKMVDYNLGRAQSVLLMGLGYVDGITH
jgi:hypothetical protein